VHIIAEKRNPVNCMVIGVPPGTRTPTNGFGDRYTAIILMRLKLELNYLKLTPDTHRLL
jgi:hypothetical protein